MLLTSPKARLITFFQDRFNKILFQQLTHDGSYIYILPKTIDVSLTLMQIVIYSCYFHAIESIALEQFLYGKKCKRMKLY